VNILVVSLLAWHIEVDDLVLISVVNIEGGLSRGSGLKEYLP
jgi:hypothetical protein